MMKLCPRCNGNMLLEEYLGDAEFVCIQCGYRVDAQRNPAYPALTRKAA